MKILYSYRLNSPVSANQTQNDSDNSDNQENVDQTTSVPYEKAEYPANDKQNCDKVQYIDHNAIKLVTSVYEVPENGFGN
jgi:hypothetical protein